MQVELAKCAGSCYGVQRALDMALNAAEGPRQVQTLGPLIHNPQVVARLEERGASVAKTPEDIHAQSVVIRSHGVTPQVRAAVEAKGVEILDATCPHVLRAQRAASDLARKCGTVLVVGERSHPEVEALCTWAEAAGAKAITVSSEEELPTECSEPVGIVVQTTQRRAVLDEVLSHLHSRGIAFELRDTICEATHDRQLAAEELSRRVDAMVVIGGRNSSNTTRLYEICAAAAPLAFHVETAEELRPRDFEGLRSVGVTAGASTPEDLIQSVVSLLESW